MLLSNVSPLGWALLNQECFLRSVDVELFPSRPTWTEVGRAASSWASPLTSVRWARRVSTGFFVTAESQLCGTLINTDRVVSCSAFSSLAVLDGGPWAEESWSLEKMLS